MKKTTKLLAISGVGIVAIGSVIGGALALFTDSSEKASHGTVGTVMIDATDMILSNPDNINPGDYDPDMPTSYVPTEGDPRFDPENPTKEVSISTTPHDLTFSITNNGTKSIRTRHTLVISVKDVNGDYLDARRFQLYEDIEESGKVDTALMPEAAQELTGKVYVAADDKEYTSEEQIPDGTLIKAVRYRFTPDIFDGTGLQAETEEVSSVKATDGPASKAYDYKLAFDMESTNSYQGASLSIEAVFEAMQYRNTVQDDWSVVSTQSFTAEVATSSVEKAPERAVD